jgi:predicted Zn finger-like uncharacterized protein
MNLTCPKCKTVFQVDESDYAVILQQVKNEEFDAEIKRRLKEIERQHIVEDKAKAIEFERRSEQQLAAKDRAMGELEKKKRPRNIQPQSAD